MKLLIILLLLGSSLYAAKYDKKTGLIETIDCNYFLQKGDKALADVDNLTRRRLNALGYSAQSAKAVANYMRYRICLDN